ncbi:MAG: hypothetical protein AAF517_19000, partial [Planctomycetota bacterium]
PIEERSMLWVDGSLATGVNLRKLRDLIGPLSVEWGRTPYVNLQREECAGSFCELMLGRSDRKQLLAQSVIRGQGQRVVGKRRETGFLEQRMVDLLDRMASKGTEA